MECKSICFYRPMVDIIYRKALFKGLKYFATATNAIVARNNLLINIPFYESETK